MKKTTTQFFVFVKETHLPHSQALVLEELQDEFLVNFIITTNSTSQKTLTFFYQLHKNSRISQNMIKEITQFSGTVYSKQISICWENWP